MAPLTISLTCSSKPKRDCPVTAAAEAWGQRALRSTGRLGELMLTLVALLAGRMGSVAQEIDHLPIALPGGMPGLPVMTGIERSTNGVKVTWFGPSGYYQLLQKRGLTDSGWHPVGGLTLSNQARLPLTQDNPFFRVTGPSPQYAGDSVCAGCHVERYQSVHHTPHVTAFSDTGFASLGGQTNRSCLACHTVGAGLPSGFASKSTTPLLGGVQCESCHGPAARHAASPDDFTVRPRFEIAATLCGGCHTEKSIPSHAADRHPPYYEDWGASGHQSVRAEVKEAFAVRSSAPDAISSCGGCHSGSVRSRMMAKSALPSASEAGAVGIVCATCHDPHAQHVHANSLHGSRSFTNALTGRSFTVPNQTLGAIYTNQLREPLSSLEDYHGNGTLDARYNPRINTCAQCHNDQGASALVTDRPPHASPQYNILLGTVGEVSLSARPNFPATHSRLEKQCVTCHMQTSGHQSGHQFKVSSYEACVVCHGSVANAQGIVSFVKSGIQTLSQQVKASLDRWAVQRAPASLQKYGKLAWEYDQAGQLSSPDGKLRGPVSSGTDPSRDEQKYIPINIKKARFNLYLVLNDGSYGAHNGPLTIALLSDAQAWVQEELSTPPTAR